MCGATAIRTYGQPDAYGSNSAVDASGLQRLGLCIAGLKQPSAMRGGTTAAVAKQRRARDERADKRNRQRGR